MNQAPAPWSEKHAPLSEGATAKNVSSCYGVQAAGSQHAGLCPAAEARRDSSVAGTRQSGKGEQDGSADLRVVRWESKREEVRAVSVALARHTAGGGVGIGKSEAAPCVLMCRSAAERGERQALWFSRVTRSQNSTHRKNMVSWKRLHLR